MRRMGHVFWATAVSGALTATPALAQEYLQSSIHPLRVHYAPGQEAKAAKILAAADDAWSYQVGDKGFLPPPADSGLLGSDDFDVLVQPTPFIAYTEAITPASDRPLGWASHLVLDPSLPDSALPLVVSHELHHAVQAGVCLVGNNLGEAGAVFVSGIHRAGEAWHLTYSLGFNTYQQAPWKSVDWQAGTGNYYPYGGALFFMFVDETRGDGTPLSTYRTLLSDMYAKTEGASECPSYLDAYRQRFDLDDAYAEFARWRYFVGPEDDGAHFADLANWEGPDQHLESVALDADLDLGALPIEGAPLVEAPMEYGAAYVRLALAGLGAGERIALSLSGDPAVRWRLGVLRLGAAGAEDQEIVVPESGALDVELDPEGADRLVLVFVDLGDGAHVDDGSDWKRAPLTYSLARVAPAPEQPPPDEEPAPPRAKAKAASTDPEPEGCACRAAGPRSGGPAWAAALALLAAATRRRRR